MGKRLQKIKPIADDVVEVFGNQRAREFNRKAQAEVDRVVKRGQGFHREIADNAVRVEGLGKDVMNAFREYIKWGVW